VLCWLQLCFCWTCKLCRLKSCWHWTCERIMKAVLGINHQSICKPHFKTLWVLTVPLQYTHTHTHTHTHTQSWLEFLFNILACLFLNSEIHNKFTRNMKYLHVSHRDLSLYQKSVYYRSVKVFNSLPNRIVDLVQKKV
jgi:hypothetical protein